MAKYRETEIFKNPESQIKATKLHFLVHPGFLLEGSSRQEGNKSQLVELLLAYEKKAESLGPQEIMFIFLFGSRANIKVDAEFLKPAYLETVRKIKQKLKNRAIVLSASMDPRHPEMDAAILRKLAETRGFYFDQDSLSEAYGEVFDWCVEAAASNLNNKFGLNKPTNIHSTLTDARIWGGLSESSKIQLNEKYKKSNKHIEVE